MHVVTIDVPHLRQPQPPGARRRGRRRDRPAARRRRVEAAAERGRGRHRRGRRDPHPQRLRLRRAVLSRAARRGVPGRGRRGRRVRPDRRPRQRDARLRRPRPARHRHPGPHAAAPRPTWPPTRPPATTRPGALFSGGSLLHGTVGRTDLVDPGLTTAADPRPVAHRPTARALPPRPRCTRPTASAASAPAARRPTPTGTVTIGDQRGNNPALTTPHEHVRHHAARGPRPGAEPLRPHGRAQPRRRLGPAARHHGSTPTRSTRRSRAAPTSSTSAAARSTPPVTSRARSSVPAGPQCAVYAGWVTPWGSELVLVSDSEDGARAAGAPSSRRSGSRASRTAVLDGSRAASWTGLRRTDWAGFVADPPAAGSVVLDVRRPEEWCAGTSPERATSRCTSCPHRLEEIPPARSGCTATAGYRAAVAAGLLDRAGRDVVLVDDDFARVAELGMPLQRVRPATAGA